MERRMNAAVSCAHLSESLTATWYESLGGSGVRIREFYPDWPFPHSLARTGGSDIVPLMRDLLLLAIHVIVVFAKLLRPGGARAVLAESLALKHQLIIINRPKARSEFKFARSLCARTDQSFFEPASHCQGFRDSLACHVLQDPQCIGCAQVSSAILVVSKTA